MSRKKNQLRNKLGAAVIDGRMTLAQAQAQLSRPAVTKGAGSAPPAAPGWSIPGWAGPVPTGPTEADLEYARLKAHYAQRDADLVKGARRAPPGPSAEDVVTKAYAAARATSAASAWISSPPPVVPRQLSPLNARIVEALRQRSASVAHDPGQREQLAAQIARITGSPA